MLRKNKRQSLGLALLLWSLFLLAKPQVYVMLEDSGEGEILLEKRLKEAGESSLSSLLAE